MIADFLFGPRVGPTATRTNAMRPLVLDIDSVTDIAREIERRMAGILNVSTDYARSRWTTRNGEIQETALATSSAADRAHLRLRVTATKPTQNGAGQPATADLEFGAKQIPIVDVTFPLDYPNADLPLRDAIVTYLIDLGTPRFNLRRLYALLPIALVVAALVAFIWTLTTTNPPIPVQAFGWIGIVTIAVVGYQALKSIRSHVEKHPIGHRIRDESRAETYSRRADSKRDLKIAAITGIVALATGYAAAYLTYVAGING